MERKSNDAWWQSDWFCGGVAPLLPVAALVIALLLGVGKATMLLMLVGSSLPLILLLGTGLIVLFGGLVVELWRERRPAMLAFLAIIIVAVYWAHSTRAPNCVSEMTAAGQISCIP